MPQSVARRNAPAETPYRYQMLPLVEDEAGLHFGWPQVAVDTGNAMLKLGRAGENAVGIGDYPGEAVMPTAQDASLLAGLAMTGGLAVPRGAGTVAARLASNPKEATPVGWTAALANLRREQALTRERMAEARRRLGKPADPEQESAAIRMQDFDEAPPEVRELAKGYGDEALDLWRDGGLSPEDIRARLNKKYGSIFSNPGHPAPMAMAGQQNQPDPFESALQDLQGILVDLNGDGQPDAVMPQGGQGGPGFELIQPPTASPPAPGNMLARGGEGGQPAAPLFTPQRMDDLQDQNHDRRNEMRRLQGLPPLSPFNAPSPDSGNQIAGGNAMLRFAQGGPVMTDASPQAPQEQPPNRNFMQMVAQNPRGWGAAPPAARPVQEQEPWAFQGEARNISRPQEYTAPIAEMTPPIIPGAGMAMRGAGAVMRAARPAAAPIAAGAGMLGGMSATSESDESPVSNLERQRARLAQQQDDAARRREQERATGEGPAFKKADADYQEATAQINAIDRQIDAYRNSPERQQDIDKRARELEAEAKAKEAATPFRERYPEAAGALPAVGLALSAGLPFALRGKAAVGTLFPGSYSGQVRSAIRDAEGAVAGGNRNAMAISASELGHLLAARPTRTSNAMHAAAAAGAGGALTAEAGMFPEQYDAYNLPEGPAKEQARERALNPLEYGERAVMGTITGLSGYKAGALVPELRPPRMARANAMREAAERGSAGVPAASPQVVTRIRTKDGRTVFQGDRGRFVSPPNREP